MTKLTMKYTIDDIPQPYWNIYRNGKYVASCHTLWGAKWKVKRLKKSDKKLKEYTKQQEMKLVPKEKPIIEIKENVNSRPIGMIVNTSQVNSKNVYELVLDESLNIIDAGKITIKGKTTYHDDVNLESLFDILLELNHIRIDPKHNNEKILSNFAEKIQKCGVSILQAPRQPDGFKPLGELSHVLRLRIAPDKTCIFLSEARKLGVVK